MKTESIRKVILVGSILLVGVAVCVSVWFFLRMHKTRDLPTREYSSREQQSLFPINNGLATENRNTLQSSLNSDEEPLDRYEKVARNAKSDFISLWSEEELATPHLQKLLEVMDDSPAFRVYLQDVEKNGPSTRKWLEFLESQGVPVSWGALTKTFRVHFPTGEPEDYEPEMRLKIAKLFLSVKPVDLTNPREAALQRQKVLDKFRLKDRRNFAWLLGQFDWEWEGAIQNASFRPNIESNPAFIWITDVQQNAASIVAAAEAAGDDAPETQTSASSWGDLSSVGESPSASHSETEMPITAAPSERTMMTDTEIGAAIEKSLTSQPPDIPTNKSPDASSKVQSNLETTLKAQFSSERFERAMDTLERYGPEEGLRRLRENDPEVANQIERHRNREEADQ